MPEPDIRVINNSSPTAYDFNPSTYDASEGATVSFRATGNSALDFFAYKRNGSSVVWAFTSGAGPYTAPRSNEDPRSYQLCVTGTVTLSRNDPRNVPGDVAGLNGTINVGGGDQGPL